MGQYRFPVNLDKREFINPHKLGSGLKLWEQLANRDAGVGAALVVLTAAMPEARGIGDLDLQENWHGPERTFPKHNTSPGPMPEQYPVIAARTIGRWAGDRIAIVGDYAEDGDLKNSQVPASAIYGLCHSPEDGEFKSDDPKAKPFADITLDVCAVIEHELNGKYDGDGWRRFKRNEDK